MYSQLYMLHIPIWNDSIPYLFFLLSGKFEEICRIIFNIAKSLCPPLDPKYLIIDFEKGNTLPFSKIQWSSISPDSASADSTHHGCGDCKYGTELGCFGVGEDYWESLGLQGDPTSPFWRRSALGFVWKEWWKSWNSSTLATSCEELTCWKRLWCWEGLGARGEGDDRGWNGWMASQTWWTWVLSELWELVMDREAWRAAIHGITKSRTRLSNWSDLIWCKRLEHPWILVSAGVFWKQCPGNTEEQLYSQIQL